jgi:citrate lyase subunit beta/citryl-CoA lyase
MRSELFVPARDPAVIAKAAASAADAVCIDLEDSVSVDHKAASRPNVARGLSELDFRGKRRVFRINALDTGFALRDVIEVVEAAGSYVDAVMVPKVGSANDVRFVDQLLTQIEMERGLQRGRIGIEAQIETAAGMAWLREIAQASPRLQVLIFGPGDYSASMRMPSSGIGAHDANDASYPGHRWHAAMHNIVVAARAFGLLCLDGPYAAYNDRAGFERSCRIARAMGFDGKQCIHPSQIPTVHTAFSPTAEEVAHAQRIVDACELAQREGRGVARLDGAMIDAASARMAEVVLDQHRRSVR